MTHQDHPVAEHYAAKLERRQGYERLALELGREHAGLVDDLAASRQTIIAELMPKAAEVGIAFGALADLLGVSRQTLYRWRDSVNLKRAIEAN